MIAVLLSLGVLTVIGLLACRRARLEGEWNES